MENQTVIKSLDTLAGSQMPITLSSNHTWLEGFVDNVLKQAFCELVITLKSTSVGDFIHRLEKHLKCGWTHATHYELKLQAEIQLQRQKFLWVLIHKNFCL